VAEIGYTLSSEEHGPQELVGQAVAAEAAGFDFASISDHFHPWTDRQGNAPFVWTVLGAVLQATERLPLITGVTCPTVRIHPVIIAQAAATVASLAPGRFSLGLGSGENLNEHILGDRWPSVAVRQEMLEESVEVIRELWTGSLISHRGRHYEVENARLYTVPDEPPPILLASAGEAATELAGRIGDGLVGLAPAPEMIEQFAGAGGRDKPCYGQVHVCLGESEEQARKTALEWWPNGGLPGNLFVELPLPSHFEEASELVGESEIAEGVVCGPEPDHHIEAIMEFLDAGYSHVYVHQVGPHGEDFFDFYRDRVLPELD
jgi:coenzyme F420-dependent glucose-6-phosphate dehydrogenase